MNQLTRDQDVNMWMRVMDEMHWLLHNLCTISVICHLYASCMFFVFFCLFDVLMSTFLVVMGEWSSLRAAHYDDSRVGITGQ